MVPWSTEWNRLLEPEEYSPAQAQEARDYIVTSFEGGFCPACWARNFGPTGWRSKGLATETSVCLTCEIVWPPRVVLDRWDFTAHPEAAASMGSTMREVSHLAQVVQARKEEA